MEQEVEVLKQKLQEKAAEEEQANKDTGIRARKRAKVPSGLRFGF